MRTILVLFVFMVATCFTNELKAQLSLGGGIGFFTEGSNLSIQGRGIYDIADEWRGGADFNYLLVSGGTFWDLNLNGHYVFLNDDFIAYALAGLNYFNSGGGTVTTQTPFGPITVETESSSSAGLNIGGGGQLKFTDAISGLAEIKYIARTGGTLVISAGVLFALGN